MSASLDLMESPTVASGEGLPAQQILRLETYFEGRTRAYGMFVDRFGKLRRQFQLEIEGVVAADQLTLNEHFIYDDGERVERTWRIDILGGGAYRGSAQDVVGEAEGQAVGNSFHWAYKFDLRLDEKKIWRVGFDDWFHLHGDGVLLNRAHVTRWGLRLGDLTTCFIKP